MSEPAGNRERLRYPIGKFVAPSRIGEGERSAWIGQLAELPRLLRDAVADLDATQLETVYREGGWTVRQLVHHLPDSHLNSYVRFRLALTQDNPEINVYDEAAWAELSDARSAPVEFSLALLEGLHARWVILLRSLAGEQFERTFRHRELGQVSLGWLLGFYAWHGQHHVAQIAALRSREGW